MNWNHTSLRWNSELLKFCSSCQVGRWTVPFRLFRQSCVRLGANGLITVLSSFKQASLPTHTQSICIHWQIVSPMMTRPLRLCNMPVVIEVLIRKNQALLISICQALCCPCMLHRVKVYFRVTICIVRASTEASSEWNMLAKHRTAKDNVKKTLHVLAINGMQVLDGFGLDRSVLCWKVGTFKFEYTNIISPTVCSCWYS